MLTSSLVGEDTNQERDDLNGRRLEKAQKTIGEHWSDIGRRLGAHKKKISYRVNVYTK